MTKREKVLLIEKIKELLSRNGFILDRFGNYKSFNKKYRVKIKKRLRNRTIQIKYNRLDHLFRPVFA